MFILQVLQLPTNPDSAHHFLLPLLSKNIFKVTLCRILLLGARRFGYSPMLACEQTIQYENTSNVRHEVHCSPCQFIECLTATICSYSPDPEWLDHRGAWSMSIGNIAVKGKIFLSRTRAQKEGRVIEGGLHSYNQDKMTSEEFTFILTQFHQCQSVWGIVQRRCIPVLAAVNTDSKSKAEQRLLYGITKQD